MALSASQLFSTSGSLFATAEFAFSDGSVTITLTNYTTAHSAADLLTDLMFTLSPVGSVSYYQASGQLINVANDGSTTVATGSPAWGFGVYNGGYLLCTVCGTVFKSPDGPSQGILGPGPGTGTTPYKGADGSIDGNPSHNPFLNQTASFTLKGASITADTVASNVSFSFGTTFGAEVVGTPGGGTGQGGGDPVPEPATFMFVGTGLVSAAVLFKRRCLR
jgi:hypothetical protein